MQDGELLSRMKQFSKLIRKYVLDMMNNAQSSHIGSCYSIVEILTVLYLKILNIDPKNPNWEDRDRFVLSKAHASPTLYAVLSELGFFPKNLLMKYYVDGGILPNHLDKYSVPGIEFSLGSLGHGLSVGLGMALGNHLNRNPGRVFVLLGDGECNEGSVWEAAMLAPHLKLKNLTAIIDYNKIQSFGNTNEVINQEPVAQKWKSFGWEVFEIDGHKFNELIDSLSQPLSKPRMIIAHTVKGKGVSFMENSLDWHYKSTNKEQYEKALKELNDSN